MYESKMRNNNQPGTGANHTYNQIITVMAWAVVARAPWILSLSPTLGWIAWGVWADATVAGVEGVYGNPFLFNTLWLKPLSSGYPTIHTITPKTL